MVSLNSGRIAYYPLAGQENLFHFRVNDFFRVSCEPQENRIVLRRFGAHDDVNGNP